MLLLQLDGQPVAVARRAWTEDGSYLSSIATRHGFRGSGLASLVTLHAVREALEQGVGLVHLAVDADNDAALHLYEGLGFALVGDPVPDLLLH